MPGAAAQTMLIPCIPQKDDAKMPLVKKVQKEHLLMSEMSLIGIVGGTLGLFVGFSFTGSLEWIHDYWEKVWPYLILCHSKAQAKMLKSIIKYLVSQLNFHSSHSLYSH